MGGKTKSHRQKIQKRVFKDNPVWVALYQNNPSDDPENSDVEPIAWDEGKRINLPDWDTGSSEVSFNETEKLLNNNTGQDVKVKYFVIWDAETGGSASYWGSTPTVYVPNGESTSIKDSDFQIREKGKETD